jgi:hypothetical protein
MTSVRLLTVLLTGSIGVWSFSPVPAHTFPSQRRGSQIRLDLAQPRDHQVHVYDQVFTTDVCDEMHELAVEHADRSSTDGSSVFFRNVDKKNKHLHEPLTPLERALDSCLVELGDTTSTVVEYWSRQEHINIDVHSDIDEEELEESGRIICPEWGHVLYLDVNVPDGGPTIIFPQMLGGWKQKKGEGVDLVSVPAVVGRVLRFPGSAMHAVPQPVGRWLLTDAEESEIREREREEMNQQDGEDDDDDDDEWGEDEEEEDDDAGYDDDEPLVERSVILFNTWGHSGPRGVQVDPVGGVIPDGIDVDDGVSGYIASQRRQQFEDWKEDYGDDFDSLHCQPKEDWVEQEIRSSTETASSPRVALMGQKVRRLHPKKNVRFEVQGDLKQALYESTQPVFLQGE